jgi:hypothetical protein
MRMDCECDIKSGNTCFDKITTTALALGYPDLSFGHAL